MNTEAITKAAKATQDVTMSFSEVVGHLLTAGVEFRQSRLLNCLASREPFQGPRTIYRDRKKRSACLALRGAEAMVSLIACNYSMADSTASNSRVANVVAESDMA